MSQVTTHVLDTAAGGRRPESRSRWSPTARPARARARTDADGRVGDWAGPTRPRHPPAAASTRPASRARAPRRSSPRWWSPSWSTVRRAPPRAAAAQPVRLLDLPGELTWAIVLGDNQYGKAEIRLIQVDRDTDAPRAARPHRLQLPRRRHRRGAPRRRQQHVLPTDTQKNTVFAFARRARRRARSRTSGSPLARHFVDDVGAGAPGRRTRSRSTRWERSRDHDQLVPRAGRETRTTHGRPRRRRRRGSVAACTTWCCSSRPGSEFRGFATDGSRRCPRPTTASWHVARPRGGATPSRGRRLAGVVRRGARRR